MAENMIPRSITTKLRASIQRSPAVLLMGARQTGKTTLVKKIAKDHGYHFISLDDVTILAAAQQDPVGFITNIPKPVIIDEVQRAPELFLSIKKDIDEQRKPGRYLLTGSANPLLIPRLSDSLAGRMEILYLWPLAQSELEGTNGLFIEMLFEKKLPHMPEEKLTKHDLYKRVITGGFPSVQKTDHEGTKAWFEGYVTTLLYRDVQELANITGLVELPRLLRIIATRIGGLFNAADISRSTGISATTLHRYITLLETLFLVQFLLPWFSNLGKRLLKSPKLFCVDTGLISFLLDLDAARLNNDQILASHILENFVLMELRKQATWSSIRVSLLHMRSAAGAEVDIVLETPAGEIIGIEIKNSATVQAKDFSGLNFLREAAGDTFLRGIIIYTGSSAVPFGDNFWAIPISWLWRM
jgi:uncharacterized protein